MPPKKAAKGKGAVAETNDDNKFDGIQLESKQVSTLILMLKGDEGSIVKNSVESLYKYADKSVENKLDLFKQQAVPLLFNLLLNSTEEKFGEHKLLITRFASMTIGVLSSVLEVRKQIKKQPEWIKALIELLVTSGDSNLDQVIIEFVCLVMANLSLEFTGKVALAKVEADKSRLPSSLVRLLPHADPDIIYNSCRALNNLAEDFENLAVIRAQEQIEEYLLDLLASKYPAIQKCSLTLLRNLTQEASSAQKVGELQGVQALIDILGNEKLGDLHELSLCVLANCFKVTTLLAEARNQGALLRLLQMSGRETGKNSSDTGMLQPEVMAALAQAFENIAVDRTNADILVDEKIHETMLKYMAFEDDNVKAAAASAVATLSRNVFFKETFAVNGIELLVKLLRSGHAKSIENALLALSVLMLNCTANIQLVVRSNGIELICEKADRKSVAEDDIILNALAALRSISLDGTARRDALSTNLLREKMRHLLAASSQDIRMSAANTLTAYLTDTESRLELGSAKDNVVALLALLEADTPSLREAGAAAVHAFAAEPHAAQELAANGALARLQTAAVKQPNSITIHHAFEKLLEHNLSVKYAICGDLNSTDRIEDGFYDTGNKFISGGTGQQDGSVFPSVEDLAKEDISHCRPIIYVNSGENKLAEPEPKKETKRTNSGNRKAAEKSKADAAASTAAKKSAKSAKSKGKDNKTEEDEKADNEPAKPTHPDPLQTDEVLVRYHEDLKSQVKYNHTMKDQVEIIANYVTKCMGGIVTPDTVDHLGWQVHLSEKKLKYKSNVVPIGDIQLGTFTHRSLLFKVLSDRIGLPVSLMRGNYNRAWNEIVLPTDQGVHKSFVIDLMFTPGALIEATQLQAQKYMQL